METTRCERCGYDNPGEPSACAQCGATLVTSATVARSEAAAPVWQRPQAPKPTEAPPWSNAENAAPWQTPPEFGKPGRPRAVAEQGAADEDPDGGAEPIAERPPRPSRPRLPVRAVAVSALLQVGALALLVYAVYAVVARRGIFADLASAPGSVPLVTAEGSDTTNLTLFLISGLLAVAAAGCFAWWVVRGLRMQQFDAMRPTPGGTPPGSNDDPADFESLGLGSAMLLGLGWIVAAGAGVLAVLVAFALHLGGNASTIATGYIVLGAGTGAIAVAMVRAGWLVYRTERTEAAQAAGLVEFPGAPVPN